MHRGREVETARRGSRAQAWARGAGAHGAHQVPRTRWMRRKQWPRGASCRYRCAEAGTMSLLATLGRRKVEPGRWEWHAAIQSQVRLRCPWARSRGFIRSRRLARCSGDCLSRGGAAIGRALGGIAQALHDQADIVQHCASRPFGRRPFRARKLDVRKSAAWSVGYAASPCSQKSRLA